MSESKTFDTTVLLRQRENMVVVVIIFIFLFLTRAVYQKQMIEYKKLKSSIKLEEEKGAALDNILALNEKIKFYRVRSWASMETSMIVDQLNILASEVPLRIKNISPGKKEDQTNYAVTPFDLQCEGTYKELTKFIQKIENFPKGIVRVTELRLQPVRRLSKYSAEEARLTEATQLIIRLSVETYYLKK